MRIRRITWRQVSIVALAAAAGGLGYALSNTQDAYGRSYALPERGKNTYRLTYVGEMAVYCGHRGRDWLVDLNVQWMAERVKRVTSLGYNSRDTAAIVDKAARDAAEAARADALLDDLPAVCVRVRKSDDLAEADQVVARWRDRDWSDLSQIQATAR